MNHKNGIVLAESLCFKVTNKLQYYHLSIIQGFDPKKKSYRVKGLWLQASIYNFKSLNQVMDLPYIVLE